MLHVWEVRDKNQIQSWLEKLDLRKQTWLLSDLRTKFEIQDLFLQKNGYFLEESVLRISDLWKKIALRSHPQFKIMTPQAAMLHLRFFLRSHGELLGLPESSEKTLLKWMSDLSVIYFHPQGEERLNEWFSQNPEQEAAWKEWWLRSKAAFSYFENKKQILATWIPAFLQRERDVSVYWDKGLIVDLGGQLSFVEAELLQQISKRHDVVVIAPILNTASEKYGDVLQPYDYLRGFSDQLKKIDSNPMSISQKFESFSSTLGSIRESTAQIREWIEAGIKPNCIAIVAPDIENLWPTLAFHLELEGVPLRKSKVSSYQSVVSVQYFLSKLRALSMNLSSRDLELSYFGNEKSKPGVDFERFEALYKNIYDETDYARVEKVSQSLKTDWDLKKPMNQMQFIFYISQIGLQEEIPVWMEGLVRDLLGSFDENFQLPWDDWISFSEVSLSRQEVCEFEGDPEGLLVTNLMSAHFLTATHRVFLDLSEENLKGKSDQGIMPQSARKIASDLGYWISHVERSDLEFELEWAAQCGRGTDHYYFAAASLTGQTLTPSSVWLKLKNSGHANFKTPAKVVLDTKVNESTVPHKRLLQDLGEKDLDQLQNIRLQVLSPSALEAFFKCPFIYFARQTLKLKTFPEIDLDLDRRLAGEALHHLFEIILTKGLASWPEKDLDNLLEEARPAYFSSIGDSFWPSQKKKMIKICQRFIQFENDWRKSHPRSRKNHTEVNWQGIIDNVVFRGRIDRVDESDKKELVVIDYKLSGSQLKGAHQWIENGSMQMLFYIKALESGWAEGIEGQVVAAFYYVVKNFARETGFELQYESPGFFENTKKRSQKLNDESKLELLSEFDELVSTLVQRIKKGSIENKPHDEKNCPTCDWRRLCRAPHLS